MQQTISYLKNVVLELLLSTLTYFLYTIFVALIFNLIGKVYFMKILSLPIYSLPFFCGFLLITILVRFQNFISEILFVITAKYISLFFLFGFIANIILERNPTFSMKSVLELLCAALLFFSFYSMFMKFLVQRFQTPIFNEPR